MWVGIGIGINRNRFARGIFDAYSARVVADGGITEAGSCVDSTSDLLKTASLLIIPSGYKGGKAYAEIPTNGNGDLTWTRASTALRTNSSGLLESMGSGVPRLSYMYGSCPALLLEPQRTNLCLRSNEFSNVTSWFASNLTVSDNSQTGIDGNTTAALITTTSTFNLLNQQIAVTAGTVYTFSFYVKRGTMTDMKYRVRNVTGASDIIPPTSYYSQTNSSTFTRIYVTITAPVGCLAITFYPLSDTGSIGTAILTQAQVEVGAYPTTIIPTTTASATRIADSFSRNNIYTNGLITSSGGTWFVELRNNITYTRDTVMYLGVGDTSNLNTNALFIMPGVTSLSVIRKRVAGAESALYTTTTTTVKIAIKWNGSTADVFVNGTKQVSATAFTTTNMEFFAANATAVPLFIQAMALYPSPLSDTDCTTLTTL